LKVGLQKLKKYNNIFLKPLIRGFFMHNTLPFDITYDIYLYMDKSLKKQIVSDYLSGKSSVKLSEELKISKPTILKVLNEFNVIRKRNRCESLNIIDENGNFVVYRQCPNCKQEIKTSSKEKTIACRNHFRKISDGSLCKPCSLELQKGSGNPFYGKKHNDNSLKKISNSRKGKGTGLKNAMSNEKWRTKASENLRKKWESGDLELTRKKMSDTLKQTRRLGKIKSGVTSKKEKDIIEFLKKLGIESIQSYRVDTKICDIYIPKYNLIIEYFGDYWHCNPNKYKSDYFNQKKNMLAEEIWDYDKKKVDLIVSYGYNLEVVWEKELKHNNKKIINIITKYDTNFRFAPERS
jgi:G:T-mismatch repair DNA endonuclease (very short patch repair protein)